MPCFALLHSMIGWKNLRHFCNQLKLKPKQIVTCSHIFANVWHHLHVFALSPDWYCAVYFLWLIRVVILVLVLQHSLKKHSSHPLWFSCDTYFKSNSSPCICTRILSSGQPHWSLAPSQEVSLPYHSEGHVLYFVCFRNLLNNHWEKMNCWHSGANLLISH